MCFNSYIYPRYKVSLMRINIVMGKPILSKSLCASAVTLLMLLLHPMGDFKLPEVYFGVRGHLSPCSG